MHLVELFGLPKAGKSTAATALCEHLLAIDMRAEVVKERAGVCPIQDKLHPRFNLWTSVALLKEAVEAIDREVPVLIADRGILDSAVWMNMLGSQESEERRSFDALREVPILRNVYSCAVYLSCDLNVVLDRRAQRQHTPRAGRIVNRQILERYVSSYAAVKDNFPVPVFEVDSTGISVHDLIARVVAQVDAHLGCSGGSVKEVMGVSVPKAT